MRSTSLSCVAYLREHTAGSSQSLTLFPEGGDRSTIVLHLSECALETKPSGIECTKWPENDGGSGPTKRPAVTSA